MTSFAYRCMICRGRNTFGRRIDDYKRQPKCRHCGWAGAPGRERFYLDKARQYRDDYCNCDGYHHKHRKGSAFCVHHKDHEFNVRTRRYGEDPDTVRGDIAIDKSFDVNYQAVIDFENEGNAPCPF